MPQPVPKARNSHLTIDDMRQIAKERGGLCLSEYYVNTQTHLQWQCAQGHQWSATPATVRNFGTWCKTCAYINRRLGIDTMYQLARERGGQCLSDQYVDWKTPLLWQCGDGHQWPARPTYIQKGNWCPVCAREKGRLTIKEMKQIAKEHGGRCLSKTYVNNSTHLEWECANHHRWQAVPASIKQGTWCPVCVVDARRNTLAEMQALAREHGGECLSTHYIGVGELLEWRCAQGHIWEAPGNAIKSGVWCKRCFFDRMKDSLENMHAMAQAKGGRCLSTAYVNSTTHLEWECAVGHRWQAMPTTIKKAWCPACKFDQTRLGIGKMQELARMHGGRCLSEIYKNCGTRLTWQCIEGHIWEMTPTAVKLGYWCRECSRIHGAKQQLLDRKKKKTKFAMPKRI